VGEHTANQQSRHDARADAMRLAKFIVGMIRIYIPGHTDELCYVKFSERARELGLLADSEIFERTFRHWIV
jgi:hypothetical protein